MNIEQNLQKAEQLLTVWNKEATHPEANRLDVSISAGNLRPAVTALHNAHWGYLSAITGLDLGPASDQMEALYHFCNGAAITTSRGPGSGHCWDKAATNCLASAMVLCSFQLAAIIG